MAIEAGQRLLQYRLIEKLGEGGMGVVWKAVDTSLERDVAIKVLPETMADDAERMARFDREAKLLASLEHPSIASVYGLHEHEGTRFLAMEYVPGEDLSQRLARGPFAVTDALAVARQVADALASAHTNGVIHRDLKPANIMLTPEGKAKVLDFGLAKAFEADPASADNPSMSPTLTSAGTVAGMILGTAAYMSPEQARGHAADKRSDVWAFGCVLYEMLTQRQLFGGETVSDSLASVLKTEPDWDRLPADLPRGIRRLLRRCLRKDAEQRLHDAADARIEIDDALASPGDDTSDDGRSVAVAPGRRWPIAFAVAATALAAVAVGWTLAPDSAEPPTRRFVITSPDPKQEFRRPVIAPDGRRIAYIVDGTLMIRDLDRVEPREIETEERVIVAFWSHDSTHLAYVSERKLWKIPADGGSPIRISDAKEIFAGAWREDDVIVLSGSHDLYSVPARGGDLERIDGVERSRFIDLHGFDLLPGGAMVVGVHFGNADQGLEIWGEGEHREILRLSDSGISDPRWVASGYIVYSRGQTNAGIWAIPFDPGAGEPTGEPFLVDASGAGANVSRDGTMVHVPLGAQSEAQLVWVAHDGTIGPVIGQSQERIFMPALSPDGTRVAVSGVESNTADIWVHDVARGTKTKLTFLGQTVAQPTWSGDGKTIYFFYPAFGGDPKIHRVSADGRGEPEALVAGRRFTLSPNEEHVVFEHEDVNQDAGLRHWTIGGSAEPEVFLDTEADETEPVFSPDGRFVAYESDESGRDEVYIKPFPSGEGKWQVSVDGGAIPRWGRNGDRLYYTTEDAMYRVDVETEGGLRLSSPVKLFGEGEEGLLVSFNGYDVIPDGEHERFVLVQTVEKETEKPTLRGIFVVENWTGELED